MNTPALAIERLSKTFPGGLQALNQISLEVQRGDFFALLGPNGAGKSTTIGIVTSLVSKSAGKVRIFGIDIDEDFPAARAVVGVVPQELNFNMFESTLNIVVTQAGYYGIGRKVAMERAEHYLRLLSLWDKRHEIARSLSGGMKRRLLVARALVHRPRLLILDEPTAGVDLELRHSMWHFLRRLNREEGVSIILTTHYLEEAEELCQHLAIIDRGHIVHHGTVSEATQRMEQQYFLVETEQPLPAALADSGLQRQAKSNCSLEIVLDREQSLQDILAPLTAAGVRVTGIRPVRNRLEQFFLSLTQPNTEQLDEGASKVPAPQAPVVAGD